jgi:hypothetical protein
MKRVGVALALTIIRIIQPAVANMRGSEVGRGPPRRLRRNAIPEPRLSVFHAPA